MSAKKIITKRKNGTISVKTVITDKSMTDQSFKKDCDINNIMAKFRKTHQITHLAKTQGRYLDVSSLGNLGDAFNLVSDAMDMFEDLPADVRKRFSHSPLELEKWLLDASNRDEAIKLGLILDTKSTETKPSGAVASQEPPPKSDKAPKGGADDQGS